MQTRRDLLKSLAGAATATLAMPEPRTRASTLDGATIVHPAPRADAIIVLWMAGGMAAPDTFDPKKHKPFEPGLAVADVISTFPAIPTAIDGVQICAGLPEIASVLDRATQSGDAGLREHRSAAGGDRRERGDQGVHHRRLLR